MNRFTELVGSRLPLQQAGMSGTATSTLAAAVSNAGVLGMIGVGRQQVSVVARYLDEVATLRSNVTREGSEIFQAWRNRIARSTFAPASVSIAASRAPLAG